MPAWLLAMSHPTRTAPNAPAALGSERRAVRDDAALVTSAEHTAAEAVSKQVRVAVVVESVRQPFRVGLVSSRDLRRASIDEDDVLEDNAIRIQRRRDAASSALRVDDRLRLWIRRLNGQRSRETAQVEPLFIGALVHANRIAEHAAAMADETVLCSRVAPTKSVAGAKTKRTSVLTTTFSSVQLFAGLSTASPFT